jgi:hypothetical protein
MPEKIHFYEHHAEIQDFNCKVSLIPAASKEMKNPFNLTAFSVQKHRSKLLFSMVSLNNLLRH